MPLAMFPAFGARSNDRGCSAPPPPRIFTPACLTIPSPRRTAVRNVALQREIALATGGQSYDLETFHRFVDDFQPPRKAEQSVIVRPLWHTWLCFAVVVGLMLVEWFVRKLLNLR